MPIISKSKYIKKKKKANSSKLKSFLRYTHAVPTKVLIQGRISPSLSNSCCESRIIAPYMELELMINLAVTCIAYFSCCRRFLNSFTTVQVRRWLTGPMAKEGNIASQQVTFLKFTNLKQFPLHILKNWTSAPRTWRTKQRVFSIFQ